MGVVVCVGVCECGFHMPAVTTCGNEETNHGLLVDILPGVDYGITRLLGPSQDHQGLHPGASSTHSSHVWLSMVNHQHMV